MVSLLLKDLHVYLSHRSVLGEYMCISKIIIIYKDCILDKFYWSESFSLVIITPDLQV